MILPVTLSGLPAGIPAIWPLKFGFRTTTKFLFGAYDCTMYGPVEGIPFVDWSVGGVFAGTNAANSVARMLSMSPSGCEIGRASCRERGEVWGVGAEGWCVTGSEDGRQSRDAHKW